MIRRFIKWIIEPAVYEIMADRKMGDPECECYPSAENWMGHLNRERALMEKLLKGFRADLAKVQRRYNSGIKK